jgi:hypothetical protein
VEDRLCGAPCTRIHRDPVMPSHLLGDPRRDMLAGPGGGRERARVCRHPGPPVPGPVHRAFRVIRRPPLRLDDACPGPEPVHPTEIWLGAFRPRMIRLVGQKADGWLPSLGVLTREELSAGNELIDESAAGAGRDPRRIRRVLNSRGDRRQAQLALGAAAGGLTLRGTVCRRPGVVGRDSDGLCGRRIRHAGVVARRRYARPGRAPRGRGRTCWWKTGDNRFPLGTRTANMGDGSGTGQTIAGLS